eukprot:3146654-Pyramimonas_sp.AAC.1
MAEFSLESLHRYTSNESGVEQWTVKGAKRAGVVFDPRCSVEAGCDCLQIRDQLWTGRSDGTSWPKGITALASNTFSVEFRSDSSQEFWARCHSKSTLKSPIRVTITCSDKPQRLHMTGNRFERCESEHPGVVKHE